MVRKQEQTVFANRLKNCNFITVKNAKHEIFFSTDDIMNDYVNTVIEFFA